MLLQAGGHVSHSPFWKATDTQAQKCGHERVCQMGWPSYKGTKCLGDSRYIEQIQNPVEKPGQLRLPGALC